MSEQSMSRRDMLMKVSLAAGLAVGVPAAAVAEDEPPYTAVPVAREDWAYTGSWGLVFVFKAEDPAVLALRPLDPQTYDLTWYLPSARFVASGQIEPMGSANAYKGWVYALTWSKKPNGAPDAVFVSDEKTKIGGDENLYPVCFYFKGRKGWEYGFNWVRTKVERRM